MTLEQLAWSGACDGLLAAEGARVGADRRSALWQLGLASPAVGIEEGADATEKTAWQLALPFELPVAPPLRKLGRWQRLIADYSTSGVTVGDHAMAVLRERLTAHRLATSAQLTRLPSGCEIALAGLVIARQRPGTANGTMFLLFEDEFGTVNLIVPREVYERRRHLARAEPLLLARGRLERHQEGVRTVLRRGEEHGTVVREVTEADGEPIRPVINLLVRELEPLERYLDGALAEPGAEGATVRRLEPQRGGHEGESEAAPRWARACARSPRRSRASRPDAAARRLARACSGAPGARPTAGLDSRPCARSSWQTSTRPSGRRSRAMSRIRGAARRKRSQWVEKTHYVGVPGEHGGLLAAAAALVADVTAGERALPGRRRGRRDRGARHARARSGEGRRRGDPRGRGAPGA